MCDNDTYHIFKRACAVIHMPLWTNIALNLPPPSYFVYKSMLCAGETAQTCRMFSMFAAHGLTCYLCHI